MALAFLALLILINSVFVAAEMALASSRKARLEAAAKTGGAGARAALALYNEPTRFLSTVQIGITLIGILSGAFGESAIADRLTPRIAQIEMLAPYAAGLSLTLTVLVLTFMTIVFGELVPKRLAQSFPERFSAFFARPMRIVSRVAAPAVWALSHTTDLILRLLPFRAPVGNAGAEEEVRSLMRAGTTEGIFHESEQRIVERVFSLSDRTVKSLMVPRPDIDWLPADASVNRIRVAVATSSHSHFPVCNTGLDDLIGVVHVKDLVKSGLISDEIKLAELVRKPMYVPETLPALKLLETFRQRQDRVAFVLDEYGVLEGLVTLNDVVEAIVGDVTGGSDADPEPMIVTRADGSFLLDGMLPVDELRTLMYGPDGLETPLPKESEATFETLGGFVLAYLGRIPATGDSFEFERYRFEVVDMDRHRIDKILLHITPPDSTAADSDPSAL